MKNKFCFDKKLLVLLILIFIFLSGIYLVKQADHPQTTSAKAATRASSGDDLICKSKYPLYNQQIKPNYDSSDDYCLSNSESSPLCNISRGDISDAITVLCGSRSVACCRKIGGSNYLNFNTINNGYCQKVSGFSTAYCGASCSITSYDLNIPCRVKSFGRLQEGKCCQPGRAPTITLTPQPTRTPRPSITPTITLTPTPINYLRNESCGKIRINCSTTFSSNRTDRDNGVKNTDKSGKSLTSVCVLRKGTKAEDAECMISLENSNDKNYCDGQQFAYPIIKNGGSIIRTCYAAYFGNGIETQGKSYKVCDIGRYSVLESGQTGIDKCKANMSKPRPTPSP